MIHERSLLQATMVLDSSKAGGAESCVRDCGELVIEQMRAWSKSRLGGRHGRKLTRQSTCSNLQFGEPGALLSRACTTSTWPFSQACMRGVHPCSHAMPVLSVRISQLQSCPYTSTIHKLIRHEVWNLKHVSALGVCALQPP